MFSWVAGKSCQASCVGADPTTDTVKFIASDLHTEEEEQGPREQERQDKLRLEEARKRAEETERHRLEQARLQAERERAEAAERHRFEEARLEQMRKDIEERDRAELARLQKQERLRLLEEQKRQEEAQEQRQERARKEEEAAEQELQAWLQKNKYDGVNAKKSKMMRTRYPLHDAVAQKDPAAVRLLLRFGADSTLKNSSGKTAHDMARSTKGCDDIVAAFTSPARVRVGGA